MALYPIISRLSTLGLRQHQEFDYDFHDFRTDFIGESGAGKSMIADLLQLILVGSEAFESATAAMGGRRTPDGMVLKTKDARGTDIGYAFINIKISESDFVVIGTYIQSTGRMTIPFTIQHGYDETELSPLKQQLSFADFLHDERIIPLEDLIVYLESKGFVCKSWHRRKQYHKFLYQHQLLGLDLSGNEKALKDYATIIQSFSRGKSLETQKGSALKDFLFGDDAAKRIFSSYQSAVNELQEGFEQYARNKSDIELITNKQQRLYTLLGLEREVEDARYKSLFHDLQYTKQEKERWLKEVESLGASTSSNYNSLKVLRSTLDELRERAEVDAVSARMRYDRALKEHSDQETKWNVILKVDEWLKRYNASIDELLSVYQHYAGLRLSERTLNNVNSMLDKKGLQSLFDSLLPIESAAAIIEVLERNIMKMEADIEEKTSFQRFMDINNVGSLGRWALEQQRGFSLEEESMIMHFKDLSTRKPNNTGKSILRYIPAPEMLFRNPSFTEPDEAGGWLHLNGIREYVPWLKDQLLSIDNQQHLRQFFERETSNLENQIIDTKTRITGHQQLKQVAINTNFDEYLLALEKKEQIMEMGNEDDFRKQSEALLVEYISAYSEKLALYELFTETKSELDEALEDMQQSKVFHTSINTLFLNVDEVLKSDGRNSGWQEAFGSILPSLENPILFEQERKYLYELLGRQPDKARFLTEKVTQHRKDLNTFGLNNAWAKLKEAEEEFKTAILEFEKAYQFIPPDSFEDKSYKNEGDELRIAYQSKKARFEGIYRDIVESFIKNDQYRFENIYDTAELSITLLPAAFQGLKVTSSNIIESINNYLAKINDKNRELNRRKFQKINDLLDQVADEVNDRVSMVRRIDLFLNEEEKEITGGHRVRLQSSQSREYPMEWITNFQSMLKDDSGDLNAPRLSEGISLEDKMLAAFNACSGNTRSKPKIDKLLDPNSYFELEYSMKSENGFVNKGSNGQSYAGIALLCIARLHIIGAGVGSKGRNGIRFMPIDEAEGLGSNYDMLHNIAKQYKYQIVSFAINPIGTFVDGELFIYMLSKDLSQSDDINHMPLSIRCEKDMDLLN